MSGRESPLPSKDPLEAWVSRRSKIREESSELEQPRFHLLKAGSSASWPRYEDSPTSASDTTCSSVTSELEVKEAAQFMHKFLQRHYQASPDKLRFLSCADLVTSAICDKGEKLMDELFKVSLIQDALQFLLQETSSPNPKEREVTLSRMIRLVDCIPSHAIGKQGMKDLKLGQVVGCFTLCCSDPCEKVCLWGADGLHHVYTLIMQLKSKTLAEDSEKYQELMNEWEEEKLFWLAWFSDVTSITTIFKRWLRGDDQTDFILMAIKGMRDDNIHHTECSVRMMRTMLMDPVPELVKAPKAIQVTHKHLEHITDKQAIRVISHYLCLLGRAYPEKVVKTLLSCSLQCDSASAIIWRALTSTSDVAMKILISLQTVLLEQPLRPGCLLTETLSPLAAISALYEILKHPTPAVKEALKEQYPMLSIALLCQISYTMRLMPKEIEVYWRTCVQQKTPTPLVPFRSALRTFKALLRLASNGDESLILINRRGTDLLINPSTHQKGLYLFARAMVKNQGGGSILPYLLQTLDGPEDFRHVTVMTFLVELLRNQRFSISTEYQIIQQLWRQLNSPKVELQSLALEGMLLLGPHPKKMAILEPALPDILAKLKESNRELIVKVLKVLRFLLKSLTSQGARSCSLNVADQVMPLFDDASHKVRMAAITTFTCLFDVNKRNQEGSMKKLALVSLVPLMMRLYDMSTPVVQVSREALKKVDGFLKSFIQMRIREEVTWEYCSKLLERYRKPGEIIFMEQGFSFLENHQVPIRRGAIRLLEAIATGSKNPETVSSINNVLSVVKRDPEPNIMLDRILEDLTRELPESRVRRSCFRRFKKSWRQWWDRHLLWLEDEPEESRERRHPQSTHSSPT